MSIPSIPDSVRWRNGMVLEPDHFRSTDVRAATMSHVAALSGDCWPWGFLAFELDATALAAARLHVDGEGVFPNGEPFRCSGLSRILRQGKDGDRANFHIARNPNGDDVALRDGDGAPSADSLPVARLIFHGDVWNVLPDWSPPALLIGSGHQLRADLNQQLGSLAALGAGFMATLRLPGAEERPVARVLGQVAAELARGVGVMEALLAAPAVAPGRLGIEALRLALGVRCAAGMFESLDDVWDPSDQRGSIRRLLYAAESAASGIGLPFRATLFQQDDDAGALVARGVPSDGVLLAIEASRPPDLIAARAWFDGSALAAPDRIQEALTRRVAGCRRHPVERDAGIGVSSGPLLALYRVDADLSWRGGHHDLALAAKSPAPANTSFSLLIPEAVGEEASAPHAAAPGHPDFGGGQPWNGAGRLDR